jgi:hypothetical protein
MFRRRILTSARGSLPSRASTGIILSPVFGQYTGSWGGPDVVPKQAAFKRLFQQV